MLTTAYYFSQVVLCSGVMMGYYWLVLRNKRFHQYNRFYLLAIALLSWIVPLIKIRWSHPVVSQDPQMIRFLSVVADNNSQIDESLINNGFQWSLDTMATLIYITVAGILLVGMLLAFFRVYQLLKKHSCKNVGDVYLVLTQARGTPFSFFRYIFWNEDIDIRSEAGKQILQHELTHVQQKHSIDKIFIQLMLIAGWFNPFFWLLKKEMEMIHEFIADKKAVNNGDTASLAQMLLTAAYPQQQFALTHPFFFSPIKRRLQMLTNNKNPRFTYIRRLIALPLLAILLVLFAFRSKEQRANGTVSVASVVENVVDAIANKGSVTDNTSNISVFNNAMLDRTYTVVIDAGHGGADKGAMGEDGTSESQITLQLAKMIRDLNTNDQIHIVLTRETDITQSVMKKAELANQYHPDLFVSLHCNTTSIVKNRKGEISEQQKTGIEFFIPTKEKAADYTGSQLLAGHLAASMNTLGENMLGIKSRQKRIWVLGEVKSPSVLIETGFITNKNDLLKLKDAAYQKQMAEAVLQGINNYLSKPVQTKVNLPNLGLDTVIIISKEKGKPDNFITGVTLKSSPLNKALMILDGKKVDNSILETLDPTLIESVNVLKGESATVLYGDEGKNGVVVIKTKEYAKSQEFLSVKGKMTMKDNVDTIPDGSFKHKEKNLADSVFVFGKKDGNRNSNTPLFVIDGIKTLNGELRTNDIYSVSILKDKIAMDKYGEEGKNGVVEITTKNAANENDKMDSKSDVVFTQVQVPAEFPGGLASWTKYLERNLNKDVVKKNGGPPGKYRVVVSFMVDKEGNLSKIQAENDPGYGTKDEAVKLIVKGPKWKPAVQNDKNVNSVRRQSITWVVSEPDITIKGNDDKPVNSSNTNSKKKTAKQKAYESILEKAKVNNLKTFFTINNKSCVLTDKGSWAEIAGTTNIVIVNSKRITPEELNNKYKRSDFVLVAASATKETIKKYGKGVLLVSSKMLTQKEVSSLLE